MQKHRDCWTDLQPHCLSVASRPLWLLAHRERVIERTGEPAEAVEHLKLQSQLKLQQLNSELAMRICAAQHWMQQLHCSSFERQLWATRLVAVVSSLESIQFGSVAIAVRMSIGVDPVNWVIEIEAIELVPLLVQFSFVSCSMACLIEMYVLMSMNQAETCSQRRMGLIHALEQ